MMEGASPPLLVQGMEVTARCRATDGRRWEGRQLVLSTPKTRVRTVHNDIIPADEFVLLSRFRRVTEAVHDSLVLLSAVEHGVGALCCPEQHHCVAYC